MTRGFLVGLVTLCLLAGADLSMAGPRDDQPRAVDTASGVVETQSPDPTAQDLTGGHFSTRRATRIDSTAPHRSPPRAAGVEPGGGQIPNGADVPGNPLRLRNNGFFLRLEWDPSCLAGDIDYTVYRGTIGDFDNFNVAICSTGGATMLDQPLPGTDAFYLVVPTDGLIEGSYGTDSNGVERGPKNIFCRTQMAATCSP